MRGVRRPPGARACSRRSMSWDWASRLVPLTIASNTIPGLANLYFYGLCILPAAPAIAPPDCAQRRRKPLCLLDFRRIVLATGRVITGADCSISGPRGGVGRAGSHWAVIPVPADPIFPERSAGQQPRIARKRGDGPLDPPRRLPPSPLSALRSQLTAHVPVSAGLGALAHRPCRARFPTGPRGCALRGRPC